MVSTLMNAQVLGDSPIEEDKISDWLVDDDSSYFGTYYFGISEMESECVLYKNDTILLFTVKQNGSPYYGPDGSFGGWNSIIDTYTNVRVIDNLFYTSETNGEFVLYDDGSIMKRCLKLNEPPIDAYNGKYELGIYYETDSNSLVVGKYPLTSIEIISPAKLETMTLEQLQIMRNEIFARHGYIFVQGGPMDLYFRKKPWYRPKLENVNHLLNYIEKYNIKNIIKIENEGE